MLIYNAEPQQLNRVLPGFLLFPAFLIDDLASFGAFDSVKMPQEFQVVRCYSCQTFQGQQVKKAKKWSCKVCGEKQSYAKIYGQGEPFITFAVEWHVEI